MSEVKNEKTKNQYQLKISRMEEHLEKEMILLELKIKQYNESSYGVLKDDLKEEIDDKKWELVRYESLIQEFRKISGTKIPKVEVIVTSYCDFLESNAIYPLNIDSYQRPFVWDKEKIEELINDLEDYLSAENGLSYFMGTILLHNNKDKEKLFIIDGQQRLTTLSVLYFALNKELHSKVKMTYNSPLSAKNIKEAQRIFCSVKEKFNDKAEELFKKIKFTFIITDSEDLAFTFFDTQNNRGVKLYPTDLLKAFHLRSIGNAAFVDIQTDCAQRWEKIQKSSTIFGSKDFLAELFHQFLWRSRRWIGQRVIYHERDELIRQEFEKYSVEAISPYEVELYPNASNTLGEKLTIKLKDGFVVQPSPYNVSNRSANLPFALRQPISKGLGFFLFAEKYADLIHVLFFSDFKSSNTEIRALREFYNQVWKSLSIYLKELFVLSILMYYDKFQSKNLLEFALRLDDSLGAIRFNKKYIFKQAALIYLKESRNNLLDVISQSFRPEEVFRFLKENTEYDEYIKEIEPSKGVQGAYKSCLQKYYDREDFENKKYWITTEFIQTKLRN